MHGIVRRQHGGVTIANGKRELGPSQDDAFLMVCVRIVVRELRAEFGRPGSTDRRRLCSRLSRAVDDSKPIWSCVEPPQEVGWRQGAWTTSGEAGSSADATPHRRECVVHGLERFSRPRSGFKSAAFRAGLNPCASSASTKAQRRASTRSRSAGFTLAT